MLTIGVSSKSSASACGFACLGGNEQAGEGWSDFLAIAFLMNPAIDDPEGPRGYGQYPLYADSRVGPGFPPAAVLAEHGAPTVHVLDQDGRLARGLVARPAARARARLGPSSGTWPGTS